MQRDAQCHKWQKKNYYCYVVYGCLSTYQVYNKKPRVQQLFKEM